MPTIKDKERPTKRLYTVEEASHYLGRSVTSVRELIWAGRLRCVKVGKRIHLDVYVMDDFIERHQISYV